MLVQQIDDNIRRISIKNKPVSKSFSSQLLRNSADSDKMVHSGEREYLFAIMTVCQRVTLPINAGDQTTKIQNHRCNKDVPNLVSTVILTHTIISQYLQVVLASTRDRLRETSKSCFRQWYAVSAFP